ncbi:HET-domain-containing protein [Corynespora cassiicola Philippines]|uniref:HET-domain-containing protein n=1 Tax=Corynespora cassiicola Philippines TaxID=1448308 RepID=A0A2T2N4N6_CORCC|nr:HET-domain-containing protein [Corynespora cassiicola Philippines]
MLYKQLVADEIRLITIHPSADQDDQVQCTLEHFNISDEFYTDEHLASLQKEYENHGIRPSQLRSLSQDWVLVNSPNASATSNLPRFRYRWGDYMALSYTWGDPAITRRILVNGIKMDVTENLDAALRVLRTQPYIKNGWKIWIDALCINQQDIIERATQVKRMRDIYHRAITPVVWLGPSSPDSQQAIQLIKAIARDDDLQNPNSLSSVLHNDQAVFGDGSWKAFHEFALRRFWSRAWILQEISLGKADMPVLCGEETVRWIDIHRVFKLLNRTDETINVYMQRELESAGRQLDKRIFETLGVVEEIEVFKREMAADDSVDLFRVMGLSRLVAATDPRDKAYGLLALMDQELARRIQPNYKASVEEVYTDFAKLAIDVSKTLEVIRCVGATGMYSLPSWVPDWTSARMLGSLGDEPHNACGSTTAQISYAEPGALTCRGFIVDTFDGMGCIWQDESGRGWPKSTVQQSKNTLNAYGSFENMREAIWRTLVANRNVQVERLTKDWSSLLAVPALVKAQGTLPNEDLEVLASSHFAKYCNWFFEGNADFLVAGEKMSTYLLSEPSFAEISPSDLRDALIARDRINLSRRLFTTKKGYVGMARQDVLLTDIICILYGCSMPVLLRRINNGYQLVGECYVHGLMEGGALDLLQGNNVSDAEFTLR